MIDSTTKKVADYIRMEDITIKEISKNTAISNNNLHKSLTELIRPLRANEFLAICSFLKKNPNDFK
jgi:DNA-binding Xre family transcriptional regulator